jgi:hypothetical protein
VDVISNQTIGGNKIFTGQVSFQGALSLNCKLLGTVACVDVFNSQGWSGADLCAWIVSAQGALPATGGSLSIYLNGTNVTCAGTFNIGTTTQGVRAQIFGAGNIAVQNTVTVAQGSQLFGQNGGSGNVGTTPTVITAGGSFPVSTYLLQIGPASGTADGIHIRDIQFNCNNVSGCKGALVQNTQDLGDFYNVFFLNHLGNCMDFTASSQNLTIQNVVCLASASATSDNGFVLGVNADHIAFINSSATSQAASRSTGAAFVCNGCNASFTSIHVENHVDGILLNSTSPNNGVVVINEVDGLSNITNVVHIAAAFNGAVSIHGVRKFLGTNAVKNDVAAFAHVCTDEALAKYIMSANQGTTQLDTDCSTLSSLFKAGFTIADANYNDTDASAAAEIEYNSATYDALHMRDKGASPETVAIGPGTGGAGFGVRGTAGTVSAKQWILCTYASLFCQFPQGFSPTSSILVSPTAARPSKRRALTREPREAQSLTGDLETALLSFSQILHQDLSRNRFAEEREWYEDALFYQRRQWLKWDNSNKRWSLVKQDPDKPRPMPVTNHYARTINAVANQLGSGRRRSTGSRSMIPTRQDAARSLPSRPAERSTKNPTLRS